MCTGISWNVCIRVGSIDYRWDTETNKHIYFEYKYMYAFRYSYSYSYRYGVRQWIKQVRH